jgi:molybdenum cofactor synthesis domain-containing protein
MPREGVFARVIREGEIRPGDEMTAVLPKPDRPFSAAVITMSDKGANGERVDESGPAAAEMLKAAGYEVVETLILPDEPELLKKELIRLSDGRQVDLILTSGGTGFSGRDQTPEATMAVADRNAPGIAEYIRMRSMQVTDRAMLGRGVSVIRGGTLIVNLPGSPKAVRESLGFILDALDHGLRILRGSAGECARK